MIEKFKKTLRTAANVGCGFEGDAEDAAELLTLITGLESRIAELESDRRWIPVSERLPEEYEEVWATDGHHMWVPEFYQKWDGEHLSFGAIDNLVTHWLPCSWIPDLPEVTE